MKTPIALILIIATVFFIGMGSTQISSVDVPDTVGDHTIDPESYKAGYHAAMEDFYALQEESH